ncbi:type VI secretion system ATPase TssH [Alienimonas californiensis]|uniref:Chaperone protein ClpB n=1 Tax=Alienimonas californiensis TaxID=2527989 RepID=A0A517P4E3_9PLAN|nr:type VI secretion system ATPase TssH [Alienimonas californiensis]QDT14254.1 Chaperone protein ClpB [Alienimonas californiensis]
MDVDLKSLIAKLNAPCRGALESAAGLCLSRTNYHVEPEHWLFRLLDLSDGDLPRILRHYGVEPSRVEVSLSNSLDRLKTGNGRAPTLSPRVVDLAREAWVLASVQYGAPAVRSGHILLAALTDRELSRLLLDAAPQLSSVSAEGLKSQLEEICDGSAEDVAPAAVASFGEGGGSGSKAGGRKGSAGTESLDKYTVDLTARARAGEIDPVLGRDAEIRQIIDVLMRRRQNNPILTGEAGVGKTAVVEGFALRIAVGDVPEPLKNVVLRTLDLGLLQAGAGMKGEFENRLRGVIDEVKSSPIPVILFVDEAHTLIGAGGQAGQGDAANLLKPALARGELRTVAATTWAEYKKYFEKDAAMARRFQVVKVEEPDEERAIQMMEGLAATLQAHHGLEILQEAVEDSVRLSHRYIPGRQLPDKSVSLLDTAAAKVALGNGATPAAVEDARRRVQMLDTKIRLLTREAASGGDHADRLVELEADKAEGEANRARLEAKWELEQGLVDQIREIRRTLGADALRPQTAAAGDGAEEGAEASEPLSKADREKLVDDLETLNEELKSAQGEEPLMQPCVDSAAVAAVVSSWTGIPVGRMLTDEIKKVAELESHMRERVVGQDHALNQIAKRIQTARAGLTDPRRPIGVFLLVGPSGVGKTETALTLAEILYGGERNVVTINMSEYQESHTVSGLKGSPPGYVGYGEGGVLTEAVRRRPYSVVLLDELEKAHTDVHELFYQVFDKGTLEDGEGRVIDFKNTVILCTSNAASDRIQALTADPDTRPEPDALAEAIQPGLLESFAPAFLGRMTVVPYFSLSDEVLRSIIGLNIGKIRDRLALNHGATLEVTDAVVEAILDRCRSVETGARNVDHILTGSVLPAVSKEILGRMAAEEEIERVKVDVGDGGAFVYEIA